MSDVPEYLETLVGKFKENLNKISAKEPEILMIGEGKQYRSTLGAFGAYVGGKATGIEEIHSPDKAGFVIFSRVETKNSKVAKCNIAFPIYVPARKSHAWPGITSVATLVNKQIPNTVALVRMGWRKKPGFIPVTSSFSKEEMAYNDQSHWDILTKSLNSDNTLIQILKAQKWDGGMMELELSIKTMTQLIPYHGKAIIEHSFLPNPSGNNITGYKWEFELEEHLKIVERLFDHLMVIQFSDTSVDGKIFWEPSLALQDIFRSDGEKFYFT